MSTGSLPEASSYSTNEKSRLRKLADYRLSGAAEDPRLARLARLTARHFDAPIVIITAVGAKMTWCVASFGPSFPAIPRDSSICSYAIRNEGITCIPDLLLDERFRDLAHENDLRYYAGAPLLSPEGYALGALCVFDRKPRPLLDIELQQDLIDFSRSVMDWLNEKLLRKHRELAERQLQDHLALLDGLLENTSHPIFVKDTKHRYTVANQGLAKLVGKERQEIIGLTSMELFDLNRNRDVLLNAVEIEKAVMAAGKEVSVAEQLSFDNGGIFRHFRTLKSPLRDARGAIRGIVGVAQDVTDMLAVENALRASEARFRAVVEQAPQLMWVNNVDGSTDFHNAAWRAYTGSTPTDANRWEDLHIDDVDHVMEMRSRALTLQSEYQFEMRVRRHDGVYRRFLGRVAPLHEDGGITAWIGVATDVDDIYSARQTAEEADRARSRFLASASHDLRQPMQSILLFAGALRSHLATDRGIAIMDRLQQGLDTLKSLLDDLIELARLDAGMVTPTILPTTLRDVLAPLDTDFAPMARAKGLEWRLDNIGTQQLVCDPQLLCRMLRALIENAILYTEQGSVTVCAINPGNGFVHIVVRDTGMGIPPDQSEQIFDELHQLHNPERDRQNGLGLGLSVVRRLSHLLNHPVEFKSELRRGSEFTVVVPLAANNLPDVTPVAPWHTDVPAPPDPASSRLQSTVRGRFSVIVEDDPIVSAALDAMLREWGFDTLVGSDPDEAMAGLVASGRKPDIVLVDYRLRADRVGTEAALRIREHFNEAIPVVIITGEIGADPARDAMLYGLALMHKPVTPRMLAEFLDRQFASQLDQPSQTRAIQH